MVTRPENCGKPWLDEEIIELLLGIRDKKTHAQIAEAHKRTVSAIVSRLRQLTWEYYQEGKTTEQIQKNTGLDKDTIINYITKRKNGGIKNKCLIQDKPQQIIESKSLNDVYSMLQELRKDIEDIKNHLKMN